MRIQCLIGAIFLSAAGAFGQSATDWIEKDKIRAAYFYGKCGLEKAELLKSKGINTLILKCKVADALPWAKEAKRLGLKCFFACNFSIDAKKAGLRQAVLADGFVERYVCPLDERFWKEHFSKSIMQAVEYSTQADNEVTGLWIDFELYHQIRQRYYTTNACYCDHCFKAFLKSQWRDAPAVAPEKRQQWLRDNGLFEKYHPYLQGRIEAFAKDLRERIHAVNPRFLLGFYPTPKNWSLIGVARGLSTKERPIILWATDTYGGGGPTRVPKDWRKTFEEQGIHTRYSAGLLLRCYTAPNLAANLYHTTQEGDGYWLFTTYTLWTPPEKCGEYYYLAGGSPDEYWAAINTANDAIVQRLRQGDAYKCPLQIKPEPTSFLKPGRGSALDTSRLVPPTAKGDAKLSNAQFRQQRQLIFCASKGQEVKITLAHRKVGSYTNGLSYTVMAPDNQIAAQGQIGLGETGEVVLTPEADGFYSLIGNPGACAFSVTKANVPVAFVTKPKTTMIRAAGPLYFHVPKGVKVFAISVKGGGGRETAKLTVLDPSGAAAASVSLTETRSSSELKVETEGRDDAVWSITITKSKDGILEDWSLSLGKPLAPLLSLSPDHVFRQQPK